MTFDEVWSIFRKQASTIFGKNLAEHFFKLGQRHPAWPQSCRAIRAIKDRNALINCSIEYRCDKPNCILLKGHDGLCSDGHELDRYILSKDGNMWCCHDEYFINLQESKAGFGATMDEAFNNYMNPRCGYDKMSLEAKVLFAGCTREKGHDGPCAHPML